MGTKTRRHSRRHVVTTGRQRARPAAVCALVSGGLDSCALLAHLTERYRLVYPLFIRQGFIWERAEVRALRRFLRALGSPRVRPLTVHHQPIGTLYGVHWSLTGRDVPDSATPDEAVYLPGRNLMLLTLAAVFCARQGICRIAIGSLADNPFADGSPEFFRQFARVAARALGQPLQVLAPFRQWSKAKVIQRYGRYPLHLSFSCLDPQHGRPCGRCNKCAERAAAVAAAATPTR